MKLEEFIELDDAMEAGIVTKGIKMPFKKFKGLSVDEHIRLQDKKFRLELKEIAKEYGGNN